MRVRLLLLLGVICLLTACNPVVGTSVQFVVWQDSVGAITALDADPSGRQIAAGNDQGGVRIWDIQAGGYITTLSAHSPTVLSVAYNQDGSRLATTGADGFVKVWDTTDFHLLYQAQLSGSANTISLFTDGTARAYTANEDGLLHLLDMTARPKDLRTFRGHSENPTSVAFIPGGRFFASGGRDKRLIVWEFAAGVIRNSIFTGSVVTDVKASADGKTLAAAGSNGIVSLFDSVPPNKAGNVFGAKSPITRIAWSPDSARIAAASQDNLVRIYDAATGLQIAVLVGHTAEPISLTWVDNDLLISGDRKSAINLWRVGGLRVPAGQPSATPLP